LEKLWSAESKTTGVNDTMATTHLDEQLLEILRKADAVYNRDIRRDVEPQHNGEHIALDVESGDYELDSSESAARERLCARRPDARVAMGRIGSSFLTNLGPSIRILP
jgi:hypothetical protein